MQPALFRYITLAIIITLTFAIGETQAYWPVSLEDSLVIANDPDIYEGDPTALPGANGTTIVIYQAAIYGCCYQIIDRYGELMLPEYYLLTPELAIPEIYGLPKVFPDGSGGLIAAWQPPNYSTLPGIYAQRLDSLGNRLWGEAGARISIYSSTFDISIDGTGGFFVAQPAVSTPYDIIVHRVDSMGNHLWGEAGINVNQDTYNQIGQKITCDGNGGCYLIWDDYRPPYTYIGALYMSHLDQNGDHLWTPGGDFFCLESWQYQRDLIPDGEEGFILMTNENGGQGNDVFRIDYNMNVLWESEDASWNQAAQIHEGEPGFFYLGFSYAAGPDSMGLWGQRMDMEGNKYWGISGVTEVGAPMTIGSYPTEDRIWCYRDKCFYSVGEFTTGSPQSIEIVKCQKLDSLGNRLWAEEGVHLNERTSWPHYEYLSIAPDFTGGAVFCWEKYDFPSHDIYARRVDADGMLGGPLHLVIDIVPENPPIQIPQNGGSFEYSVTIEDTYSIPGIFDAWIEAVLPTGDTVEILLREDVRIDSHEVVLRNGLVQNVPAGAPSGNYIYHLYVGKREYDDIWSEDSFEFVKRAVGGIQDPTNIDSWHLSGFFGEHRVEELYADTYDFLAVYPSPFNNSTTLEFTLPAAAPVELAVFDVMGREVATLVKGNMDAGNHQIIWDSGGCASGIYFVWMTVDSRQSMGRKVVLVK